MKTIYFVGVVTILGGRVFIIKYSCPIRILDAVLTLTAGFWNMIGVFRRVARKSRRRASYRLSLIIYRYSRKLKSIDFDTSDACIPIKIFFESGSFHPRGFSDDVETLGNG